MKALQAGNVRLAHARFEDAADIYPENANAHYGLGLTLIELNKLDLAREHLTVAVRLKADLYEGHYQLGSLAYTQGRMKDAQEALRNVLERDPNHGASYYLLGLIHEKNTELSEANTSFRKAVSLDPYNKQAFLMLARLYLRVAAESEAQAVLTEGIRVNLERSSIPDEGMSLLYNERGIHLMQVGRYTESIESFLNALKWDSNRVEVAFNMGCAYASQGDSELALKYFNQYIAIGPENDETVAIARDVARHLFQRVVERGDDG